MLAATVFNATVSSTPYSFLHGTFFSEIKMHGGKRQGANHFFDLCHELNFVLTASFQHNTERLYKTILHVEKSLSLLKRWQNTICELCEKPLGELRLLTQYTSPPLNMAVILGTERV